MPASPLCIGIDCAAAPERVGLALAIRPAHSPTPNLVEAACARSWDGLTQQVTQWMSTHDGPALLCLDAPLGWPVAMGERLATHHAGQGVLIPPGELFARCTDHEVARRLGKRPLEVGANYIARAALAALNFLQRIREASSLPIPLAWSPHGLPPTSAIEVYPAGVLAARGLLRPSYKKTMASRQALLDAVFHSSTPPLQLEHSIFEACLASEHLLDACLCCLAGWDFLQGEAAAPTEAQHDLAHKEGWIWVRYPEAVDSDEDAGPER